MMAFRTGEEVREMLRFPASLKGQGKSRWRHTFSLAGRAGEGDTGFVLSDTQLLPSDSRESALSSNLQTRRDELFTAPLSLTLG